MGSLVRFLCRVENRISHSKIDLLATEASKLHGESLRAVRTTSGPCESEVVLKTPSSFAQTRKSGQEDDAGPGGTWVAPLKSFVTPKRKLPAPPAAPSAAPPAAPPAEPPIERPAAPAVEQAAAAAAEPAGLAATAAPSPPTQASTA